jgi:hypothetical protein
MRNGPQNDYEVTIMEEIKAREKDISRASPTFTQIGAMFRGEQRKYECYERCMNDPWDLSRDSMCVSACGV